MVIALGLMSSIYKLAKAGEMQDPVVVSEFAGIENYNKRK